MKRTLYIITFTILYFLSGCQDETLAPNINTEDNLLLADGRVRFSLTTNVPPLSKPVTRTGTASEDGMAGGDFWVMVFDNSAATPDPLTNITLLEVAKATPTTSIAPGPYKWQTTLKSYNHAVKVVMIANAPATVYDNTGASPKNMAKDMFTPGTTYSAVLANLHTAKLAATLPAVPYTPGEIIPMVLVCDYSKLDASVNLGTEAVPLQMPRIVAKITVDNAQSSTNFTLLGANLHGARATSQLVPATTPTDVLSIGAGTSYEGATVGQETTAIASASVPAVPLPDVKETTAANPLYCYEANDTDIKKLFLIVEGTYKGTPTYYKMDISRALNGSSIGVIKRNMHYRLVISEVALPGYATYAEALSAPASNNIKWRIDVVDLTSHDLMDNGQYFLAVSNSDYIAYTNMTESTTQDYLVCTTFSYNAPAGVSVSATLTGTGLSPDWGTLPASDGTAHSVNMRIKMSDLFTTTSVGTLTLRVGNLTKTIGIRRGRTYGPAKDVIDFSDPNYVYGAVNITANDPTGTRWVRLASDNTPASFDRGYRELATHTGGMYLHFDFTKDFLAARGANVYLARRNDQGRLKVFIAPSDIIYDSNGLPAAVNYLGKAIDGSESFSITHTNPGNYPYRVGVYYNNTQLYQSPGANANITQQLVFGSYAEEPVRLNLPRQLSIRYEVNGSWYTDPVELQQRYGLTINILVLGNTGVKYHGTSDVASSYGIDLKYKTGPTTFVASSKPNGTSSWFSGLASLLQKQTGPDKPIKMPLQFYYINSGDVSGIGSKLYDYDNVINALLANNIDILMLPNTGPTNWNQTHGPTAAQAKRVIEEWLEKNPYRGLIYTGDVVENNAEYSKYIFGVVHTGYSSAVDYELLSTNDEYYYNPVYNSIMNGSYSTYQKYPDASGTLLFGSDVTNTYGGANLINLKLSTNFKGLKDFGVLQYSDVKAKGFIPILRVKGRAEVALAVHPTRRIMFMGESQFFQSGQYLNVNGSAKDGSLEAVSQGNYPKLLMNTMEWFFNNVALGKRY